MLEGEPVPTVQTGTNYSLQVSDLGATSTTGNYIKWTTELKDLRETKYYKGTLEITFGSALGLVIDRDNIYNYVDIIVDGETLNKDYESNTSLNGCFYNDSNDCLIPFIVESTEGIDGGGNDVVLAKKVKLDLRGTDLNGVGSIKVVTTLKNYIIYSSTGMYLGVTAKYTDEDNG